MVKTINSITPVVSVIIPCYNHGKYLAKAIQSVYSQTYQFFELIVVDDGSVDNTKTVCINYPKVKYVYQENAGLSAARNTGIKHAKGDYLVFLDADDWLLKDALKNNLEFLNTDVNAAFVTGGYELYYEPEDKTWTIQKEIADNHYCKLLEGNFIGMHATVMYRSWVFEKFAYNVTLSYCEDYDMYLQITRFFPIIHHTKLIAVYRKHGQNMSANYVEMMKSALLALSFQKKNLKNKDEKKSYKKGVNYWKTYYSEKIYEDFVGKLYAGEVKFDKNELKILKSNNKSLYKKFINQPFEGYEGKRKDFKNRIIGILRKIYYKIKNKPEIPNAGNINLGDLNRTKPFSVNFGYDRGGPIDRYYIENFLNESSSLIKGRVLEIGDNAYTLKFGGDKLTKSDIFNVNDSNEATFIGDLSDAPNLPSNSFNCIILTQTLHLIYDYQAAIKTCNRVLKSGGTLLLTVPGISHIAQDEWGKYWLWSFTDTSMQKIIQEHFSEDKILIKTYGNVLVASAFLYGMGLPEIKKEQMDSHDPHYQVIIAVSATK
ncbi:glycosyltransferase [Gillisia limnaea]|uniref:Glycosyl transferase family 2 n=1 Tax=Gillisia limnaea (strain DSM 15749 / LMG 21470 / R-8282) TaxID=865937 RepID=H2BT36_GILLR|nr:glycosyltransferase [Gillisia limnaea]EHQ02594.1 glycosyl transferase family 2 [Gillisia limnaea DSM 15749]